MTATLLFIPPHADDPWRWVRVADGAVADRGEGLPVEPGSAIVAVTPADAVTLHWANLPARSIAQASAAARIVVSDASAGPIDALHVAVGEETVGEAGDERPIGVVANDAMQRWLAMLAAMGTDPDVMIPAPLLLPRPQAGFVRADVGGQSVVRGTTSGFADEARLTELITGADQPETLGRDAVDVAIAAALGRPVLNLRQGPFARRRRRAIDWALVRRLVVLGALALLATLAIDLVRIAKYAIAAGSAEVRAEALAREGLPRGTQAGDADRLLAERLSRLRGPGLGFSATAAAIATAVRDTAGTEIVALAFEPNGDLRATIAAEGEAQANQLVAQLRGSGFAVTASPFESNGQRLRGDLTVTVP
ncbi:type II secretion system protein GspL [Sphingomonas sp. TZW2008]|uniref:type II secretion system protein GspL n=1 Tax=Sphingomonas sp. TZW2008 TaxID=1917973 RepID=UPI000A26E98E|nr:type II secretion system protein GspL [Sphingomonas sp. TZW2008]